MIELVKMSEMIEVSNMTEAIVLVAIIGACAYTAGKYFDYLSEIWRNK